MLDVLFALIPLSTPAWLVVDRQLLSDFAGSLSFCIWLFAQTPQIYENYERGSVAGLSPFFLIQWMFGDLTNLIGAVLTHQLFFQIALAAYFCSIDTVLLSQYWYYSHKAVDHITSVPDEETERLLEEQLLSPELSTSQSRHDAASIRSTSTRSRWGYRSMRQGAEDKRDRSRSGRRRTRLASTATTMSSSVYSNHSAPDMEAQVQRPSIQHHHTSISPLLPSSGSMSVTYRALSQAAMSVAQLADEAAARRAHSRDRYGTMRASRGTQAVRTQSGRSTAAWKAAQGSSSRDAQRNSGSRSRPHGQGKDKERDDDQDQLTSASSQQSVKDGALSGSHGSSSDTSDSRQLMNRSSESAAHTRAASAEGATGLSESIDSLQSDGSAASTPSSTHSKFGYGFPSVSVSNLDGGTTSAPLESGVTIRALAPHAEAPSYQVTGDHAEAEQRAEGDLHRRELITRSTSYKRPSSRPSRPRTRTQGTGPFSPSFSRQRASADSTLSPSASQSQSVASLHSSVHASGSRTPGAARTGAKMVLLSVGMLFAIGHQTPRSSLKQPSASSAALSRDPVGSRSVQPWSIIDSGRQQSRHTLFDASVLPDRPWTSADHASDLNIRLVKRSGSEGTTDREGARRRPNHDHEQDPLQPSPDAPPNSGKKPPPPPERINWEQLIGRTASWTCTVLYLTSRLPQIWTNHMRKSVEGLSMLLFIAAFLGNFFYTISILATPKAGDWWDLGNKSTLTPENKVYLRESLPFLIGSFGASFFDVTILTQWFVFSRQGTL
ncbi:hypothetical protein OC845_003773 [Tilletia horrida]|nr:hypothetical protein OC845_003773 [Tilletia horrida]